MSPFICAIVKLSRGAVGEFQRPFQTRSASRFPRRECWFEGPDLSAYHACNTQCSPAHSVTLDTFPQITSHFETFVAYSTDSSSIILMGDVDTNEEAQPKIIPELQNRGVISIVLGDYHYGALTADGQLLAWGQYSHGALGLGIPTDLPLGAPGGYETESQRSQARRSHWGPLEPPRVASPSPVHFNHG